MKKNVPKIRFKGCQGEWERKCFDEIYQLISDRKHNIPKSEYKDLGKYPIIDQGKQYIIGYTDMGQPLVPQEGYVVFGDHTREVKFVEEPFYTGADGTKVLKKKGEDDSWFLYYCCTSISIPNTGYNRHFKYLKEAPFYIPSTLPEQHQIASYFRSLDGILSGCEARLSSLRRLKEGALQAFFPQQGETQPKIRFKGCKGEWSSSHFIEIFQFLSNNSLSRACLGSNGDVKNVHYGDVLIRFGENLDIGKEALPYISDVSYGRVLAKRCSLQDGDVIIADAAEDNTVGKATELMSVGDSTVVSGLHTIPCRPILSFEPCYLGYYLNSKTYHNQLLPLIQGTKICSISKHALEKTIVSYPPLPEQRLIAHFFRTLDHRIDLERLRLEKLKQLKAACLEKMFV